MPEPEPNKKWDSLLRAYAKKQRRDAELHPVGRRALQDEVKKTFGQPGATGKRGLFSHWWLRAPLAAIFAAFAVLLIIQNRRFEESKAASDSLSLRDNVAEKSFTAPPPSASPAPAAPAVAAAGRVFQFGNRDQLSARSQFQNNISRQTVLSAFSVDRRGSNVLVTDNDGSVYSGQVEARKDEQLDTYSFAVQGRNSSSQQTVDFKGRLEPLGVQAQTANNYAAANSLVSNSATQNQQSQQYRVLGAAVVGGTNQIKVDATLSP